MSRVTTNPDNLHELLNSLIVEHKKDIYAYSSGHLNESRLPKPEVPGTQQSKWASSSRSRETDVKPTVPKLPTSTLTRQEEMKNALLTFIGGSPMRFKPADKSIPRPTSSPLDRKTSSIVEGTKAKDGSKDADKFSLPDIRGSKQQRFASANKEGVTLPPCSVTPRHMMKVTKKEQYESMRDYENDVLRKSDTLQRDILHTNQTIQRLERKLQRALREASEDEHCSAYRRLKIHSDIFTEFIHSSPIFHDILTSIQTEYDRYLSYLLEGHVDRHEILSHQVDELSARHSIEAPLIVEEENWIQVLEDRVREQLSIKERLRSELATETALAVSAQQDTTQIPVEPEGPPEHVEPSERIESLRKAIAVQLGAIDDLRVRIRLEFVPITVCDHLRQSLRETNAEIKKLTKKLQMYKESCAQLELEFQDAISIADASDRDVRRIWRKMMSIGAISSSSDCLGQTRVDDPLKYPDDEDESTKWNWYIA